jgi:hypothetical protein
MNAASMAIDASHKKVAQNPPSAIKASMNFVQPSFYLPAKYYRTTENCFDTLPCPPLSVST